MLDRVASRSGVLRQQMISQSEKKGAGKMADQNNHGNTQHGESRNMTADEAEARMSNARDIANSEAEVEDAVMMTEGADEDFGEEPADGNSGDTVVDEAPEDVDGQPEEEVAATLSEMLTGSASIRLRIAPRIMLNVTAADAGDVPETVRVGDAYYSVSSPIRKGNGKRKNPYGLIREGLADIANYVSTTAGRDIIFFGPSDGLEDRVSDMMEYLDTQVRDLMYSAFPTPQNPSFTFLQQPEVEETSDEADEEELDDIDQIGVTEVDVSSTPQPVRVERPASDSYDVVTWPVFDTDADGTIVIRPTIAINVNMPLLVGASSYLKPVTSMQKIVNNYAKSAGIDEDDFRLTFAFRSEDLLEAPLIELLQHFSSEDSEAVIISQSYLARCVHSLDYDVYRMFPTGSTAQQAAKLLMPGTADTLLLI